VVVVAIGRRWRPRRAFAVVAGSGFVVSVAWFAGMAAGVLSTSVHLTWLPTYALWFCAGMALAIVHVAARSAIRSPRWRLLDEMAAAPGTCLAVALGLFVVASTPVTGPRDLGTATPGELVIRVVLFAAIAVLILIPAGFGPNNRFKALLSTGPARWLGTVSYGLFLWQLVVLEAIYAIQDRQPFTGDVLGTFALTLAGSLVLAGLSYYLLELPVMRWGSRLHWRPVPRDGQPQAHDGEQPDQLRGSSMVGIAGDHPQPAGHPEQADREPRLQRA